MKPRHRIAGAALLGALALAGPNRPDPPAEGDPDGAQRGGPLAWGFYYLRWSRDFDQALEREIRGFASAPDYVMFFIDLRIPYQTSRIDAISRHGATAIVSLELVVWHGGARGSYLPAINRGEYDDFFRKWARDAKAHGKRVLMRFGFEFNGNWFSWSQDPEAFVTAWRRVHKIFQDVGAANVEWVWAPNVVSCPDTPENDMHRYHPGDDYVDWIGVDGYNFGDDHDQWHKWESFEQVYANVLDGFRQRYSDKSIMIAEFGCAPGEPGRRARWIRQAYRYLQRHPRVKAAIWFNHDKTREGEPNWRLSAEDGSLPAFNETFARPPDGRGSSAVTQPAAPIGD